MLLPLLLLCFAFECLEPGVPEALEEIAELNEPLGAGPVETSGAVAPLAHEPRLLENVQMLRDRRPRDVEVRGDLACTELTVTHEREDCAPVRRGDRFQRGLHYRFI